MSDGDDIAADDFDMIATKLSTRTMTQIAIRHQLFKAHCTTL